MDKYSKYKSGSLLSLLFLISLLACNSKDGSAEKPGQPSKDRGRVVYQTQCIACHNPDPKKGGTVGPDVFGSSRELISARILKAEYPAGYKPKRTTHAMSPLPHLKDEIDSLTLFLNP